MSKDQGIVVGGGLGGMSAANTLLENNARVVLLDKSSFCGGNSSKATSGINGAGTKTQKAKDIPDNADIFTADTLKGGAKRPELAKVLCQNSAADVDWLMDKFDLDLSLVLILVQILCWPSIVLTCFICLQPMASTALGTQSKWAKPSEQRPLTWSGFRCIQRGW